MKALPFGLRTGALSVFCIFLLALLLLNADFAMDGIHRGISLCTETLFPSLFPFLVLSELFLVMHVGDTMGKALGRFLHALFGISQSGAVCYLIGLLCGFPVGTAVAVTLHRQGQLEKKELSRLILFINNPSSGFLVGAVGKALFGSSEAGAVLFFATVISSFFCGVFLRLTHGAVAPLVKKAASEPTKPLSPADFTGSVKRAFGTMLQICAFVLFFCCISQCLTSALAALELSSTLGVLLCGVTELTSGISLAVTTLTPERAFLLCAFFAGFSGLSVCMQIFSIAEGTGVSLFSYLLAKLCQGLFCLLLAKLYLLLFSPDFVTAKGVSLTQAAKSAPNLSQILLFVSFCALLLLFSCACLKRWQKIKKDRLF